MICTKNETNPGRKKVSFVPRWQRFVVHSPLSLDAPTTSCDVNIASSFAPYAYGRQYSHTYSARLNMLGPRCLHAASEHQRNATSTQSDGPAIHVPNVIEVKENQLCTVVGTLVKTTPARHLPTEIVGTYHIASTSLETLSYLGVPYDDAVRMIDPLINFCSQTGKDTLVLEDHSGRVELTPTEIVLDGTKLLKGTIAFLGEANQRNGLTAFPSHVLDVDAVATGVVACVTGTMRPSSGIMEVQTIHFPSPLAHPCLNSSRREIDLGLDVDMTNTGSEVPSNTSSHPCILLLSGLHCGAPDSSQSGSSLALLRELLVSYLVGDVDRDNASKICRVIIAGGGCGRPPRPGSDISSLYGTWMNKESSKANSTVSTSKLSGHADAALPIRELDLFLSELCAAGMPVDYIPGLHDPTNANWPQKPLHPCLLPLSGRYINMLNRCPNPYEALIGDKLVLGSDGASIADLRKFIATSRMSTSKPDLNEREEKLAISNDTHTSQVMLEPASAVDALHSSLLFSHMAPTGPDSLPMYPVSETDPFVIAESPHIYFAGNCQSFETKLVEQMCEDGSIVSTRLVCVPSFAETGQAVVVDLFTLDCRIIQFDDLGITAKNYDDEKKIADNCV